MKKAFLLLITLFIYSASVTAQTYLAKAQSADGKVGFLNMEGKVIIPMTYDESGQFSEGLVPIRKGKQWGYLDGTGKTVIPFGFEYANSFSEGLAAVQKNGSWSYINASGKTVTTKTYDLASSFSEGLAGVKSGEKWGYIDKTGAMVIEAKYDGVQGFSQGRGIVTIMNTKEGGKLEWKNGVVDKSGKEIVEPKFRKIHPFSEGIAMTESEVGGQRYTLKGLIDLEGKEIVAPMYKEMGKLSDGLIRVQDKVNRRYGYIDKTGKVKIELKFDQVWDFVDGVAVVATGKLKRGAMVKSDPKSGIVLNTEDFPKKGLINTTGASVLKMEYRVLEPAGEGMIIAEKHEKTGQGAIDTKGNEVLPFQYIRLKYIGNGIFSDAQGKSESTNLIDKSGKVLVKNGKFDTPNSKYANGMINVRTESLMKAGYIDMTGAWKIKPTYYQVWEFSAIN